MIIPFIMKRILYFVLFSVIFAVSFIRQSHRDNSTLDELFQNEHLSSQKKIETQFTDMSKVSVT